MAEAVICPRHPDVSMALRCEGCGEEACPSCLEPTRIGGRCPACTPMTGRSLLAHGGLGMALGALVACGVALFLVLGTSGALWRILGMFAVGMAGNLAVPRLMERITGRRRDPLMIGFYVTGLSIAMVVILLLYLTS